MRMNIQYSFILAFFVTFTASLTPSTKHDTVRNEDMQPRNERQVYDVTLQAGLAGQYNGLKNVQTLINEAVVSFEGLLKSGEIKPNSNREGNAGPLKIDLAFEDRPIQNRPPVAKFGGIRQGQWPTGRNSRHNERNVRQPRYWY